MFPQCLCGLILKAGTQTFIHPWCVDNCVCVCHLEATTWWNSSRCSAAYVCQLQTRPQRGSPEIAAHMMQIVTVPQCPPSLPRVHKICWSWSPYFVKLSNIWHSGIWYLHQRWCPLLVFVGEASVIAAISLLASRSTFS